MTDYDAAPINSRNFARICSGVDKDKDGKPLTYDGSRIYINQKGKRFMAGDITKNDGTGGATVTGERYIPDEKATLSSHQPPFRLGMYKKNKKDRDMNDSKFYVTYDTMYELNGWNTLIGSVFEGYDMLDEIEAAGSESGKPEAEVILTKCEVLYDR